MNWKIDTCKVIPKDHSPYFDLLPKLQSLLPPEDTDVFIDKGYHKTKLFWCDSDRGPLRHSKLHDEYDPTELEFYQLLFGSDIVIPKNNVT